jgi:tetratricopeptide (TPR) repeat protein
MPDESETPLLKKNAGFLCFGANVMNKGLFLAAFYIMIVAFFSVTSFAEEKTFLREYVYQASEVDSKISCRTIAIEQVKRLLLEELGTYLEGHSEVRSFKLTRNEIIQFTAGIVRVKMVEEYWDGNNLKYQLKAMITADPEHVVKSIDDLRRNYLKARQLEELEKKVQELLKENEKLKDELKTAKTDQTKIARFNETIEELNATDPVRNGWELSLSGRHKEALEELGKAILMKPKYSLAYAIRGGIYAKLGNYHKAIEDCTTATELDPESAVAYAMRGYIYFRLLDYPKVFADSNRAIEIDPKFASAYVLRATVYDHWGDYQKDLDDNNKAIELDPRMAVAYANRADAYRHLGKSDLSFQDAKKAVDVDPRSPDAYLARGWAYYLRGERHQALKDMNKAIS